MLVKVFIRFFSVFYLLVRIGCIILNKDIDECEDKLFDILFVDVEYIVNMFKICLICFIL